MTPINHENIDKWLFDYVEGKLNGAQKRAVQDFLQAHPYYKEDLEAWENSVVAEAEQPYPYTEQLLEISRPAAYKRYSLAIASLFLLGLSTAAWYFLSPSSTQLPEQLAVTTALSDENTPLAPVVATQPGSSASTLLPEVAEAPANAPASSSIAPEAPAYRAYSAPTHRNTATMPESAPTQDAYSQPAPSNQTAVDAAVYTETEAQTSSLPPVSHEAFSASQSQTASDLASVALATAKTKSSATLYGSQTHTAKLGNSIAVSARKVEITVHNTPELTLAGIPETDEVQEAHTAKKENLHKTRKRKKFNTYEVGLYNGRDHILLTPGRMNIAQYAAFAGNSGHPALHTNLRSQWTGSENQLLTLNAAYEQYSKKIKSAWGIGAEMQSLDQGLWKQGAVHLYYSPKIRVNKTLSIEPGVAMTYARQHTGRSLSMPRGIEPARGYTALAMPLPQGQTAQAADIFDLSVSTLVQARRFYAAAGVDHLLSPFQNVYSETGTTKDRLPKRYKAVIGADYQSFQESPWVFSPQVSFMQQGTHFEVWAGSLVRYNWAMAGASVSHQGQFTSLIGVQSGAFRLGYQFDLTRSQLTGAYYGSHEASLRFLLGSKPKKFKTILDSEK